MREITKNNTEILNDPQAFQDAYVSATKFFESFPGVVGVAFGLKETGGQYKDDIAIVVFVREKKKEEEIPPGQRIPPSFEGYRTDVRIVHRTSFHTCNNTATYKTIEGGIQITSRMNPKNGHYEPGTLGCIVRKRNDTSRENVYLLSCKHVLYAENAGEKDYVYHPFCPPAKGFGRVGDTITLGPIRDGFLGDIEFGASKCFIDCAIARIDIDSKCFGSTCTKDTIKTGESIIDLQVVGDNKIKDVRDVSDDPRIIGKKVFKVGRTTGKTTGRVLLINAPFEYQDPMDPQSPKLMGHNTIQIELDRPPDLPPDKLPKNCLGNPRFAEHGDSGAIIVDEEGRVIGLHAVGAPIEFPPDAPFPSTACHIVPILDFLKICIPCTTGTSHGSSLATDGSGIAPAQTPTQSGDFPLPDGQIVFTSQQTKATPVRSSDLTEPMPVTDDEVRHMRMLLDAFRGTQKGRDLHDSFGEVRREIGYLVRNCRPVKVVWHRHKGQAFLAHLLNHLKGDTDHVPHEVAGVSVGTLFTRLREVLSKYGSNPLRRAIDQHGTDLQHMLESGNCVQDYIAYLKKLEST